jgi:tetrahydromethanopterin S-methyltransferase subunit G
MTAGMMYQELAPTITINIVNFRYLSSTKRYHTTFHVREDEEGFLLTDVLEVHFMELPKLMDQWEKGEASPEANQLVRWLLLLEAEEHEAIRVRLEEIAMQDEAMKQAFAQWEEVSQDAESWIAYEQRRKVVLDEMSRARWIELRESALAQQELDLEQQRLAMEQQRLAMEKERVAMEQQTLAMEQEIKQAQEVGKEEGKKVGKNVGKEEGIKLGIEIGVEKNKKELAQQMLAKGMAMAEVAQITGLTEATLEALANKRK